MIKMNKKECENSIIAQSIIMSSGIALMYSTVFNDVIFGLGMGMAVLGLTLLVIQVKFMDKEIYGDYNG